MVFSSLHFLYLFLPLCILAYYLIPSVRWKNAVLIVFSLLFYAWGEPVYVLLMLAMAALNWVISLRMEQGKAVFWMVLAIVLDLAGLAVFKYAGFLVESLNAVSGWELAVPKIALPIGISFYTFQILSYVVDVCRGKVKTQHSFWRFLMYVSMFPQLIAGPIVRYADVEPQLENRSPDAEKVFRGVVRFCIGLGKKVLLADPAGKTAAQILDGTLAMQTTIGMWFGILLYAFEIYFDFSGYSDMAIGLGRIFGFDYLENFDLPYMARSITEFWRKWHMSLSGFFRDYVYIPLGGNRRRMYLNLFIVWALTGLWHGASWNFVLWGLYFFVLLTIERLTASALSHVPNPIRHFVTFVLLLIGWNIFYFTDFSSLLESFRVMFGAAGEGLWNDRTRILLLNNLPLTLVCAIGCTPIPRYVGSALAILCADRNPDGWRKKIFVLLSYVYCLLLLALSTIALAGSTFNAFLYFRF